MSYPTWQEALPTTPAAERTALAVPTPTGLMTQEFFTTARAGPEYQALVTEHAAPGLLHVSALPAAPDDEMAISFVVGAPEFQPPLLSPAPRSPFPIATELRRPPPAGVKPGPPLQRYPHPQLL